MIKHGDTSRGVSAKAMNYTQINSPMLRVLR
jgi:hypothetical protein